MISEATIFVIFLSYVFCGLATVKAYTVSTRLLQNTCYKYSVSFPLNRRPLQILIKSSNILFVYFSVCLVNLVTKLGRYEISSLFGKLKLRVLVAASNACYTCNQEVISFFQKLKLSLLLPLIYCYFVTVPISNGRYIYQHQPE